MSFLAERDMAVHALEFQGPGIRPDFPSAAARIRAAREAMGLSVEDAARRCGVDSSTYMDLELSDSAVFTDVALGRLQIVAGALGLGLLSLLFGEEPMRDIVPITFPYAARILAANVADDPSLLERASQAARCDLQLVFSDNSALAALTVRGAFGLCRLLGLDWIGLLAAVSAGAA